MSHSVTFTPDGELDAPIDQVHLGKSTPLQHEGVITIDCDKFGNLVGDTTAMPAHILEQLQTPEAKQQLRRQYQGYRNRTAEPVRKPKYVNDGGRVDYTHMKPTNMSGKEFRKLRRAEFRRMTKAALKVHSGVR